MLQFIYIFWKYLTRSIAIIGFFMIMSAIVAFAWLQLPFARSYFIQSIENDFRNRYHGELSIGSLEGLIPFRATIYDVSATWHEDGFESDTLISVKKIDLSLNPLDLLSNRLSVQSLIVSEPVVHVKYDPEYRFITLNRLFQRREAPGDLPENVVRKIAVFAPYFSVENGSVFVTFKDPDMQSIRIDGIELSSFVEFSDELQFIDLQFLMANIDILRDPFVQLKGQVYNDVNYLEFNGFRVWNNQNTIGLNGDIRNFDILQSDRKTQLKHASYSLNIDSTRVLLSDYGHIFSDLIDFSHEARLVARFSGAATRLEVDQFAFSYGQSNVNLVGEFTDVLDQDSIGYIADVRNMVINADEVRDFVPDFDERLHFLNKVSTSGRVTGDINSSKLDIRLVSGTSSLDVEGSVDWAGQLAYDLNLTTVNFDFSQLDKEFFPSSRVSSIISLNGTGLDLDSMSSTLAFSIQNSQIGDYAVDALELNGRYDRRNLTGRVSLQDGNTRLNGELQAFLSDNIDWSLTGNFRNVNLKEYILKDLIADTDLDFEINLNARGVDPDSLTGRVNLDVIRAVVAGDTLGAHQFYADIIQIDDDQRELRFTSTLLDINLSGNWNGSLISEMFDHWSTYIREQIDIEYLLLDTNPTPRSQLVSQRPADEQLDLKFDLQVKDVSLAKRYFASIPYLDVDLRGEGTVQANRHRMLLNTIVEGSSITIGNATLSGYSFVNTISLQHGQQLKDFAIADFVVRARQYQGNQLNMRGLSVLASVNGDSARVAASVTAVGQADYGGNTLVDVRLSDSSVQFRLREFILGNSAYRWSLDDSALLRLNDDRSLTIDRFRLVNRNQNISVSGTYSAEMDDILKVDITSLDLSTISGLIEGRSTFAGVLDGAFETSMLLVDPVISGYFDVNHLKIDDRTIGDVRFSSDYNSQRNRFDVEMQIYTDPVKYGEYLSRNNNIGQDIKLKGWINAPDNPASADTLYYFDVDLNQIDGWIVTAIIPSVFVSTEGAGSGSGYIWGRADYFDFNARITVNEIRAIPQFLLANYFLSGELELDRRNGITFNRINIRDNGIGTGVLTGNIGFNDFQIERPFNLEMQMSQLEFLNNSFDPDIPFYGRVFGSGRISLTGSNEAPFLRTITPITTTSNSRLSIPLLDETSVEEQARFIEFVRSFADLNNPESRQEIDQPAIEPGNRFIETVTMDLQFIAPVNSSVQLVFDPLTGEILNAQGSGRIRITLEDQNFQMFGNLNVNSGEYVFVGGDIFVRRFQLRDGGTISWDGDPANATLNITTAYRSRPNIGVLSPALRDQQTRIPVDLMLVITGTIQSIENNFYFEFPNATDVSQNASSLSILNSEDQKLIQATSLLFTGGFIPVGVAGEGQTGELGASLQARAGQVGLSQLLSNQINAILNSSLSNLDIDLNLTGFDQADIGIALRLFDDRLVLRGESQYSSAAETGAETTLGDLGITYRINRALSVEVFHRRDPTLRAIVGNQTQVESINGIGLEAQVQFNTWSEFRSRIWAQIKRFFGAGSEV